MPRGVVYVQDGVLKLIPIPTEFYMKARATVNVNSC